MNDSLLAVENLTVGFAAQNPFDSPLVAVENVCLNVRAGEIVCVVGESGCGKSVTAKAIIGLLPTPPARVLGGRIVFAGHNLLECSKAHMQRLRGNQMAMVFQDPMTSLNPVLRVGEQITEPLLLHKKLGKQQAYAAALVLLEQVGIPNPNERFYQYPHELSGGMRQRVMIAMALACTPKLILADEPTTALDVTVQRQILTLMQQLVATHNTGLLLITHDFAVVAHVAHTVAVMYAGQVVEQGAAGCILHAPAHPYTQGLLASRPGLHTPQAATTGKKPRLAAIPGMVPPLHNKPTGCLFHPRCPYALPVCQKKQPPCVAVPASGAAPNSARGTNAPCVPSKQGQPITHTAACWLLACEQQSIDAV